MFSGPIIIPIPQPAITNCGHSDISVSMFLFILTVALLYVASIFYVIILWSEACWKEDKRRAAIMTLSLPILPLYIIYKGIRYLIWAIGLAFGKDEDWFDV